MINFPLRSHTDEQLGLVDDDGLPAYAPPNPFNWPQHSQALIARNRFKRKYVRTVVVEGLALGEALSSQQVADLCRKHFKTFGGLRQAAAHFQCHIPDLSSAQTGSKPPSLRVLVAIGVRRDGETYRRVL